VAPLADRSVGVGWLFARQGDDLAHLLGRELRRGALPWGIRQPPRHAEVIQGHVSKLQPASSPVAWGLVINAQFPSNLQVVQSVAGRQHNPCSQGQLLAGRKRAHQPLQLHACIEAEGQVPIKSHPGAKWTQWAADPVQAVRNLSSSQEVSQPTGYRKHDIHAKKAVAELTRD
jgi:hypothetical protein